MVAFDILILIEHVLSCLKLDRTFCLKSEQLEAVRQLSEGQLDVCMWLLLDLTKSTNFKFICFPFVFDSLLCRTDSPSVKQSVVLVVSPLISLMIDQVKSRQARGQLQQSRFYRGIHKSLN